MITGDPASAHWSYPHTADKKRAAVKPPPWINLRNELRRAARVVAAVSSDYDTCDHSGSSEKRNYDSAAFEL